MSNIRAYEKVIEYVEDNIREGNFKIGDKLPPERDLSQLLGSSRNSVREGLCILERMGAISSQQGAGNYISNNFESTLIEVMSLMFVLKGGTFHEINQFRYGLEQQALLLAVDKATDQQIEALESYIDQLESVPDEDSKAYYDKMIHYTIAEASDNHFIIDNLQALTVVMDSFIKGMRIKILVDDVNKEGLLETHRLMVTAIKERNHSLGRIALERHFNYIKAYIDK